MIPSTHFLECEIVVGKRRYQMVRPELKLVCDSSNGWRLFLDAEVHNPQLLGEEFGDEKFQIFMKGELVFDNLK